MTVSLSQLLDDSFQIAWEYLERTGELGDAAGASRFLRDTIETMIRRGHRSELALSIPAISASSSVGHRAVSNASGMHICLKAPFPIRPPTNQ